ncbi:carboxypeptidase-like regulatory domain-containing protein [Sulfurovum sp. ST-21]|uniref:Carboxypeptidase regulatory-like domain-containing protein n=1 Tax=Sulfurovum indicum TaxID=2779528 RepID=A0A7M1S6E3_9BACT|nr:carboxypeptidase-like regulatory domain-containing protein [Sulfurovum indicum]QOR62672.1 carboxypeptidase regulatory-like domain-containing protein [Sulfurovum indicum]
MKKKYLLLLVSLFTLWFTTGCVERELPYLPGESGYGQGWGSSEDEENIDISDIDQNMTESGAMLSEEAYKVPRIPFPMDEYVRLARVGKGTVKGQIYITDGYGKKVVGKATRLYLNPKTSYSDQWYQESYIGGQKMQKADDRLFNYLRFTSSDANGNFSFYGVPSGSYYLIGTVRCGMECGYDTPKSIRIATLVTVKGNQVVQKDLVGQMY